MKAEKKLFGKTSKGESVYSYTITNGKVSAEVLDFGATLKSVYAPDKNGAVADMTIGYSEFAPYETSTGYEGKTVGRYANRLCGGKFTVDGVTYQGAVNENGKTSLHGGGEMSFAFWNVEEYKENSIKLSFDSPDGAFGFPGNMKATVEFSITENNGVKIEYTAISDKATIVNFTNHSYFNLAGKGDILGHFLRIDSNAYIPTDDDNIPTGEVKNVENTPFDFREFTRIGDRIDEDDYQLTHARGYDHNYCLGDYGKVREIAEAYDPESGRRMKVYTDLPGVQLYAGNFLSEAEGKGRKNYPRCGFCMETQFYPDTPNHADFPQCTFKAGEEFRSVTIFEFSAE